MNLLLDSNVEALAFNYLNFGLITILNNLWTWLAITAALSFWKIRSSGCPKSLDPVSVKPDQSVSVSNVTSPVEIKPDESVLISTENVTSKTETPPTLSDVSDDVDGVRKGKFTLYYKEDMQCGFNKNSSNCYRQLPVVEGWEPEVEVEWWKCWEKVLRLRNGENENGWYTCQDLTELNGNVVKIWDGGLTFVGSCITNESWSSSRCMSFE
ncbi:hypothetical protein MtrunA17_Chr2g0301421 [Medicago truncatula]|uniref:Transmembrane protein, putative n=1 Tax=Medicago truncatula TaxID=3880 RepID=A0A072VHK0_MEDTR|nr:uncharacterized protein LOC25486555 [Medicago truncatula]KEH37635.1 transmembrane protein, putative [Medicago truncatula]RHN73706.1 hypothetical protein MtrunA17_Chr2g0301421 [Medicago truncatula]